LDDLSKDVGIRFATGGLTTQVQNISRCLFSNPRDGDITIWKRGNRGRTIHLGRGSNHAANARGGTGSLEALEIDFGRNAISPNGLPNHGKSLSRHLCQSG